LLPKSFNYKPVLYKNDLYLISLSKGFINNKQLNSSYLTLKRILKQNGNIIVRLFPNTPVSKRPAEQPLGKGKANTDL